MPQLYVYQRPPTNRVVGYACCGCVRCRSTPAAPWASCFNNCGYGIMADGVECWCDEGCVARQDCCLHYEQACNWQ